MIEQSSSPCMDWLLFCDNNTDNDHIYPCPKDNKLGGYNIMCTDRCTK